MLGVARPNATANAAPGGYAVQGIDIASYQHPYGAAINWPAVKASGRSFVFIKATEGTSYTNSYYAADARAASAAGLYVGAYHFGRPDLNDPQAQADYLLSVSGYSAYLGGAMVPFLDMETGPAVGLSTCYGLSQAQMISWMQRFVAEFQVHAGRPPAIYTSNGFWSTCTGNTQLLATSPLDVARWAQTPTPLPGGWSNYAFWQYGSSEQVNGISGAVDGDVFRGKLADLQAYVAPRPRSYLRTFSADVNGDGRADVVESTGGSAIVALSAGNGFKSASVWSNSLFYGQRATLAADVNGDHKADLISVSTTSAQVMLSNGTGFGSPQLWSSFGFVATLGYLAADVNGDGRADLLAISPGRVAVMLSTGVGFAHPHVWSTYGLVGSLANVAADVNGDGRADIVAVSPGRVAVMLSTGAGFAHPDVWSPFGFAGTLANLAADVNGDRRADMIAISPWGAAVMVSTGTRFAHPSWWSLQPF